MDKVQEMTSFVAVVDAGSFVAAADATGLSKAAVSRHISDLEQRLGTRLLQRTTRRLSLTLEGHAFYTRCKELLAAIEEAESELLSRGSAPTGHIRINAPLTFGVLHLAPLWGLFCAAHPEISLDITLTDRVVDLIEEGFDVAIRISRLPSSTLISRKLATTRMRLCASEAYLDTHGAPKRPFDLASHRVISYTYLATQDEWTFEGPNGAESARITARIHTNNGDTCRRAALDHQGIVLQPDFLIGDDLRTAALIELMPDYRAIELGIYAVYPSRRYLPLKIRRLVDFLADSFRNPSWA